MNKWLACALVVTMSGCPDVKVDENETSADPIVEFDPSRSIVPFPNNLLINPMTGKVTLPAGCNESAATKATREGVLNALDGFGTFETAMSITLTKPIDMTSVTADNVLLFKSTADPSTSNPIPVLVIPSSSIRFANQMRNADGTLTCDTPNPIDSIVVVPRVPLEQKTNYIVALKKGLKTSDGAEYGASFTWSLVRQPTNPVRVDDMGNIIDDDTPLDPSTETGLASLKGINLLWNAHAPVLAFLEAKSVPRNDVLLAWSFKTQTTTDALDTTVAGTPAAALNTMPLTGPVDAAPVPVSIVAQFVNATSRMTYPFLVCTTGAGVGAPAELNDTQCFLKMTLGRTMAGAPGLACGNDQTACEQAFASGTQACAVAACANVTDVMRGRLRTAQYQIDRPNTLDPNKPIPGPWADPVKPAKVKDGLVNALILVPAGTPPANGWPTAIFQHGLGQSATNLFAIGGRLASDPDGAGTATSGFMTVAIDAVAHGDRAVQISNDAAKGCGGLVTATSAPQCFAGFLSPDLGTTRDNIRQTNHDHAQLVAALKACGNTACGPTFKVDPTHIVYIGQSLGGIIGSTTVALNADIKAAVLNVGGVGWADIFENTQTLAIRCTLVDGLIDAGTLMGEKSNLAAMPPTGLCTTDAWKTQPGYRQFAAIGRWVLDPADPANYTSRLATKKFLIQEVVNDLVVPNVATDNQAALVGRMSMPADPAASLTPTPSMALTTMPTQSKFVKYTNLPPTANPPFPGNTFSHGSLLVPAASVTMMACNPQTGANCDGLFGLTRMNSDAIFFLQANK